MIMKSRRNTKNVPGSIFEKHKYPPLEIRKNFNGKSHNFPQKNRKHKMSLFGTIAVSKRGIFIGAKILSRLIFNSNLNPHAPERTNYEPR